MFLHRKLLESRYHKSFLSGNFSPNIPEECKQLLAFSDSAIYFYLIKPNVSISLVSETQLDVPILSSCIMTLKNSDKSIIAITFEAPNNHIELIVLEFVDLIEKFEVKAKFSFEEMNKKRGGLSFQSQGLKIYSKNNTIIASAYQDFIGILSYDDKNELLSYEKEVFLGGFFGDGTFDENGQYFFAVCNNEESNKIIYKTMIRVDLRKFEISEVKICIAESNHNMVTQNVWLNFDYLFYVCDQNLRLETVNFDKDDTKKEKKPSNNSKDAKNCLILSEGFVTNIGFVNEYLMIGFDDGKVSLYNRFKISSQLSGVHTYHFPQINDSVYWEMWFYKHKLHCLVIMTSEIRVYSLNYEQNETISVIDSLEKDNFLSFKLMNSVVDSTLVRNEENDAIFCLMSESNFNLKQEINLKKINFGVKPLNFLNLKIDLMGNEIREFQNFNVFEKNDLILMFFTINKVIKMFSYSNTQLRMNEILFSDFAKENKKEQIQDILPINSDFLCFVKNSSFCLLKVETTFSKNCLVYEGTLKSKIKLCQRIFSADNKLYFVFLLENCTLNVQEFTVENEKIIQRGSYEKKLEMKQNENLFLINNHEKLSIVLTFFDQESEIIEFSYKEPKFSDIVSSFFEEIIICSIATLSANKRNVIFITTYSGELLIFSHFENKYKLIKKWTFDKETPFHLKPRNSTSLYFYSTFETYVIELIREEDIEKIKVLKVLFDFDKQPTYIFYSNSNEQEICLKGKELFFYSLSADFKKRLTPAVHDFLLKIPCDTPEKTKVLISGAKNKTPKFDKFKRLCYSNKRKVLLLISNNLWMISYDPFIFKFHCSFDLQAILFKKSYDSYSLNMFKIVTFPDGLELLCISSTTTTHNSIMVAENEDKEEDTPTHRLNFCELVASKTFFLEDPGYELRFASEKLIKKTTEKILDIVFMFELGVFVVASGNSLEVYAFETKNDEHINLSFQPVCELKIGKKIISMDVDANNMILVGDYVKSLFVFRLEKTILGNEKIKYKLVLVRAEKEQRTLSTAKVIDSDTVMGIDKYGDCFITKINNNEYVDFNGNSYNYALISLRDPSRNILETDRKFNYVREVDLNQESSQNEEIKEKMLIVPTLMGGLHQIKFGNLVYMFDNEEINRIVEKFGTFLIQQKSFKVSKSDSIFNNFSLAKKMQKFVILGFVEEFLEENNLTQEKIVDAFYFCQECQIPKLNEFKFSCKEIIAALKELQKIC